MCNLYHFPLLMITFNLSPVYKQDLSYNFVPRRPNHNDRYVK